MDVAAMNRRWSYFVQMIYLFLAHNSRIIASCNHQSIIIIHCRYLQVQPVNKMKPATCVTQSSEESLFKSFPSGHRPETLKHLQLRAPNSAKAWEVCGLLTMTCWERIPQYTNHIWRLPKMVVAQIIHFHRGFHYKPSFLGYHHSRKHPYTSTYHLFHSGLIKQWQDHPHLFVVQKRP